MMNVTVRPAQPGDAESFAAWAANNPDIPQQDINAVRKSEIPFVLVVEIDGEAAMYMPLIPAVTIGYLGFRPDLAPRPKAKAMRAMLAALKEFMGALKISDTYVFTKAEYPMGKWALRNGFKPKEKDGFTLERQ